MYTYKFFLLLLSILQDLQLGLSKHMTNTHKNQKKQRNNGKIKARTRHKALCKVLTVTIQHTLDKYNIYKD